MKPLKNKKSITVDYVVRLHDYILKHQKTYFSKENEADSFADFEEFPTSRTDRFHLCMPNEPMLIDRSYKGEHTYCICTITRRSKQTGRSRVTMEIPVIRVGELKTAYWKNGYFLLPDWSEL